MPQAPVSGRRNLLEKLVEKRTAGIKELQKRLASLARVLHGQPPEPLHK
jgi:hypothetical protein